MAGLNRVMIIGNLGDDPEIRYTADAVAVADMRVAVNEWSASDKQTTEWFSVVAWDKLAEACMRLKKGQRVFVEGRLRTRSWEKDGQRHYKTEVVARNIVFLSPLAAGERGDDQEIIDDLPVN